MATFRCCWMWIARALGSKKKSNINKYFLLPLELRAIMDVMTTDIIKNSKLHYVELKNLMFALDKIEKAYDSFYSSKS